MWYDRLCESKNNLDNWKKYSLTKKYLNSQLFLTIKMTIYCVDPDQPG